MNIHLDVYAHTSIGVAVNCVPVRACARMYIYIYTCARLHVYNERLSQAGLQVPVLIFPFQFMLGQPVDADIPSGPLSRLANQNPALMKTLVALRPLAASFFAAFCAALRLCFGHGGEPD